MTKGTKFWKYWTWVRTSWYICLPVHGSGKSHLHLLVREIEPQDERSITSFGVVAILKVFFSLSPHLTRLSTFQAALVPHPSQHTMCPLQVPLCPSPHGTPYTLAFLAFSVSRSLRYPLPHPSSTPSTSPPPPCLLTITASKTRNHSVTLSPLSMETQCDTLLGEPRKYNVTLCPVRHANTMWHSNQRDTQIQCDTLTSETCKHNVTHYPVRHANKMWNYPLDTQTLWHYLLKQASTVTLYLLVVLGDMQGCIFCLRTKACELIFIFRCWMIICMVCIHVTLLGKTVHSDTSQKKWWSGWKKMI